MAARTLQPRRSNSAAPRCLAPGVRRRALAAIAACLLARATPVCSQPAPASVYVRGSLGLATQGLADWRHSIDDFAGGYRKWQNIGTAFEPSAEVGFMATELVSVGAAVSHQQGVSDNHYEDSRYFIAERIAISMTTVTANVAFWPPAVEGLYLGGDAGIGLGKASDDFHYRDAWVPGSDLDGEGHWHGDGFVAGAFVGYQHRLGQTGLWYYRSWYRYANLGVFDGTASSPQLGTSTGPPESHGKIFTTDCSGIGVAFGFGASFGGRPREPSRGNVIQ